MTILSDVLRELFKMFVSDLRLTMSVLFGVFLLASAMYLTWIGPLVAGFVLLLFCLGVLGEAVIRETLKKTVNAGQKTKAAGNSLIEE